MAVLKPTAVGAVAPMLVAAQAGQKPEDSLCLRLPAPWDRTPRRPSVSRNEVLATLPVLGRRTHKS